MKAKKYLMSISLILVLCLVFFGCSRSTPPVPEGEFDIVITKGRIMDPETRTDAIANIGILNGCICTIVSP